MNMRKIIIAGSILFSLFIIACSGKPKAEKQGRSVEKTSAGVEKISRDTLALSLGKGFVSGEVQKEERANKYFVFKTDGPGKLSAKLISQDTMANIRFTQIFFPDGSADGPFGRTLNYELEQAGTYTLSVGENMMAGEPWTGSFTITVELEK
ncbi:hypothetical protein [Sinomicrobium weinanense]|uniref:Uncharacterized protein n=1 Tax=Sinomicrobium weinanense TaxID=2842200 RepID=A0A926JTW8_9FLAO|nr:hypothetical protein [Sinomicrobium weinanense]MBC9797447.1 hypothetical protein [Sinomicrobium weinanense]MBU3125465.1 hypothetical protein [Sinomicrobium weinanense]